LRYLDAPRRTHDYLLVDFAQDTDDLLRFPTAIFPSEITVVYAPLKNNEEDKVKYHILHVLKSANPRLRKTILQTSNKDVILGIMEAALNVLNGNFRCSTNRLRKHKAVLRHLVDERITLGTREN
jgi:hypothetical protein